jgi:hypothetical protein
MDKEEFSFSNAFNQSCQPLFHNTSGENSTCSELHTEMQFFSDLDLKGHETDQLLVYLISEYFFPAAIKYPIIRSLIRFRAFVSA